MHQIVLSDEDVTWLSELPYTLTIPGSYLGQKEDTLIVHAGLIPGQPLEDQTISTMVTIREVHPQSTVSPSSTCGSHSKTLLSLTLESWATVQYKYLVQ